MMQKEKVIFIQCKKVVLRPLCKETDLDICLRWVNDAEVKRYVEHYLPITREQEETFFEKLSNKSDEICFAIDTLEGKFIGVISIHHINWKNRVASTGAMIGEKDYWGKGYGTDAKMYLLNFAFNTLNIRKLRSSVIAFNHRSIDYSLHCGYKIEGNREKEIFCEGKYWDEVLLALFKKDWLPIWRKYKKTGKIK